MKAEKLKSNGNFRGCQVCRKRPARWLVEGAHQSCHFCKARMAGSSVAEVLKVDRISDR